jgi:hypothetical protein
MLAMNPNIHRKVAQNARAHIEMTLADRDICWANWEPLLTG